MSYWINSNNDNEEAEPTLENPKQYILSSLLNDETSIQICQQTDVNNTKRTNQRFFLTGLGHANAKQFVSKEKQCKSSVFLLIDTWIKNLFRFAQVHYMEILIC